MLALLFLPIMAPLLPAQIFTDDGTPISPETPELRTKGRYQNNENAEEASLTAELSLSVDPTREFRLAVPMERRRIQFEDDEGKKQRDTLTGPGDVTLRFQQSLQQTDRVMGSDRLALNISMNAPTGDDNRSVDGVRIPRRLQLGSGDWTAGLGGVYTRVEDRHRFSIQGTVLYHTRHDGLRRGEELHLDLAYWYRLLPSSFEPDNEQRELRGVFEINTEHRLESRTNNSGLGDSGTNVWLSPGLQFYASPTIQVEGALQIPIIEGIDDAVGDRQIAAQLNLKILF